MNEINKLRHAAYMREWRDLNEDRAREISQAANKRRRTTQHGAYLKEKQKYYDKCRQFIVEFFGGKCQSCGFSDPRALQMDHIKQRPFDEKKMVLWERYIWVRNNPEEARRKYQLLCANCNVIKRAENQEYANGRGKRGNGVQE